MTWPSGQNLQRYFMLYSQVHGIGDGVPLGYRIAEHATVCAFLGWTALLIELLFPLVLFWRRASLIFIPAVVLIHAGTALFMHIFFLDLPLLIIFVDWSKVTTLFARASR